MKTKCNYKAYRLCGLLSITVFSLLRANKRTLADDYTSIYIYNLQDGVPLAAHYAPVMEEKDPLFPRFFDIGYSLSDGAGETYRDLHVDFRNGTALVTMVNYHRALFLYPYLLGCLAFSALLFLFILLLFIGRKMKAIVVLEREVLSHDLRTPLTILNRYLEVLNLKRNPEAQEEYLVTISGWVHGQTLTVTVTNAVKQEHIEVNSNNIGLKNVQKMIYTY